jgi:hypothetical protein
MDTHFRNNERELVKIANYFKRQSRKLIAEGKLGEEHRNVEEAVDRFVEHMNQHVAQRVAILEQRVFLQKLVKDNPECPSCHTNDKLKLVGTEKNEKGWRSNRYKCRKCNITFTWNRPNNPWDMILYIEEVIHLLKAKLDEPTTNQEERESNLAAIESMQANLDKLKPVIDAHNKDYDALQARDAEMEQLIHEFKNTLMIEKIKLDTWENKRK